MLTICVLSKMNRQNDLCFLEYSAKNVTCQNCCTSKSKKLISDVVPTREKLDGISKKRTFKIFRDSIHDFISNSISWFHLKFHSMISFMIPSKIHVIQQVQDVPFLTRRQVSFFARAIKDVFWLFELICVWIWSICCYLVHIIIHLIILFSKSSHEFTTPSYIIFPVLH